MHQVRRAAPGRRAPNAAARRHTRKQEAAQARGRIRPAQLYPPSRPPPLYGRPPPHQSPYSRASGAPPDAAPSTRLKAIHARTCRPRWARDRHLSTSGSGLRHPPGTAYDRPRAAPTNVLHIGPSGIAGHPAPFPIALPAWFIRLLCPPSGLVLDPFGGSGTTAVAAIREGPNGS